MRVLVGVSGGSLLLAGLLHAVALPGLRFDRESPGRYRAEVRGLRVTLDESGIRFGNVQMRLAGARGVAPAGEWPVPGRTNYLVGAHADWRTGLSSFSRIRYREIYPGIDLVFHGATPPLEYDFVVAPGADPARIRLRVTGAVPRLPMRAISRSAACCGGVRASTRERTRSPAPSACAAARSGSRWRHTITPANW